ncbi:hypothetical protein [Staphylococcus shinii]|uniref:hypothetical protein n=1 Tax=Staphylococcus shinii TaxID=2912228 RepID=UPI003F57F68A
MFRKKQRHDQKQYELQVNIAYEDDTYSCIFITGDKLLPLSNFFVHVDKDEKILHIYNKYTSGDKSVMNLLSRTFIDEVKRGLKIKRGKYDVYLYMPPISNNQISISVYSYKEDDFISRNKSKEYFKFKEMAEDNL